MGKCWHGVHVLLERLWKGGRLIERRRCECCEEEYWVLFPMSPKRARVRGRASRRS